MATTSQEYTLERKTGANTSEEIKIPASSVVGLSTVATSGSYNDLSNKPTIPDVSGKANLTGGNTFTGKQTLNSPASDGYSINAAGYVKGSWLQATSTGKSSSNTGKVCVLDGSGWVYYRTPAEIVSDGGGAKASDIPTNYVTTNTAQDITGEKSFYRTPKFKDSIQIGDSNRIYGASDSPVVDQFLPAKDGTFAMISDIPDTSKHGYTELTNEDLNTITEVGWYRAYTGHTCKNSPTTMGFVLSVERIGGTASPNYYIQQTITTTSLTAGMIYRRRSNTGSGTPTTITMGWSTYKLVGQNTDEAFSGCKTFSNGINLNSSLQVNGSSGTAGQVLTSTGTGTPQWKTPTSGGGDSVASVVDLTGYLIGGDAYFPFNNGEEGSFTGMIYCEYNSSAGNFEFEINDQIFSCTPASQDITLRVTIDRMYNGRAYLYYYTIVSNDASIDNSGFFTDTNRDMHISTNMGSSYEQLGVGTIIKKVL